MTAEAGVSALVTVGVQPDVKGSEAFGVARA